MATPYLDWTEVTIKANGDVWCEGKFKEVPGNMLDFFGKTFQIDVYGAPFYVVIIHIEDFTKWKAIDEEQAKRRGTIGKDWLKIDKL